MHEQLYCFQSLSTTDEYTKQISWEVIQTFKKKLYKIQHIRKLYELHCVIKN